jgi:pyruvate-formate lyase-activating enzyme
MPLTGVHFLLSYQCTYECDHCFVWSSPSAGGTITLETLTAVLDQALELGSVTNIYFEGGEPFLFYPLPGMSMPATCATNRGVGFASGFRDIWDRQTYMAPRIGVEGESHE